MISSFTYSRTTTFFLHFFMFIYLFDMYFSLVMFRLWSHIEGGAGAYYRQGLIHKEKGDINGKKGAQISVETKKMVTQR